MTYQVWNWSSLQRRSDSLMNKAYIKACERLVEKAVTLNPKAARILDVGAGSGLVLRHVNRFVKKPFQYVGTDLNPAGLQILEKRASSLGVSNLVTILERDCRIENPDWIGHFDMVFSNFCLYTMNKKKDRIAALKNISAYLRPKGTFHIALPSENYGANNISIQCLKDELADNQGLFLKGLRSIFLVPYQRFFVLAPIEQKVNDGVFVRFTEKQIRAEFAAAGLAISEIQIDYGGCGYQIHGTSEV